MIAALKTLEEKIQRARSGHGTGELAQKVEALEAKVAELKEAGAEALRDVDLALTHVNDLTEASHG